MEFENDIVECLEVLHNGGIILYPTDTVWGIGCDATNADAVNKVYQLKRRAAAKSLIVLIADVRDINRFTPALDPRLYDFLENTVRPTTVIYPNALGFAENVLAEDGSVAIRIVKEDFCRHLIKRFRKPLVSTSANISGEVTPGSFSEISEEITCAVDYVVNYRRTDPTSAKPSQLVKFSDSGEVVILRP